jgi:spore coat protein CotH
MKRLLTVFLSVLWLFGCKPSGTDIPLLPEDRPDNVDWEAAYSYVFDSSVIPEIHLTFTEEEWNKLLKAYDRDPGNNDFVRCNVLYVKGDDSREIPGAGIRLRGNTSRRRPEGSNGRMHDNKNPDWHHCHFSLDFHYYEKNYLHTVEGVRQVDLKWFKDDPAYVREIYCYDLFRRFGVWTAIHDVYARVWVKAGGSHEAYFGVYGMLEHIDKNYLRVRKPLLSSAEGNLWKSVYGAGLRKSGGTFEFKCGADQELARQQFDDFVHKLNTYSNDVFYNWIESVMDIELFLRTYAVNVAVGMWDDYWNNANNYYLYFTPEGKVYFIPFDYDNTLGTSLQCGVQSDAGRQDPLHWGDDKNPLVAKILARPQWRDMYIGFLRELTTTAGLSTPAAARERILSWQQRIAPYVANDTGEDMKIEDRPASWGNHAEYRLTTFGKDNFFQAKAESVASLSF